MCLCVRSCVVCYLFFLSSVLRSRVIKQVIDILFLSWFLPFLARRVVQGNGGLSFHTQTELLEKAFIPPPIRSRPPPRLGKEMQNGKLLQKYFPRLFPFSKARGEREGGRERDTK